MNSTMGTCPACTMAVGANSKFCEHCGQKVAPVTRAVEPPPPPAPQTAPAATQRAIAVPPPPPPPGAMHASPRAQSAIPAPPPPPTSEDGDGGIVQTMADRVVGLVGMEKIRGFSVSDLISETLKKRTADDVEQYFLIGTRATTPKLSDVSTDWPKPWLFVRAFLLAMALYVGVYFMLAFFPGNPNIYPGFMMVSAFVVPFTCLVFFFEMNAPKNVSFFILMRLLFTGAVLSLAVTLVLYQMGWAREMGSLIGMSVAGPVEETGKLLAVIFLTRSLGDVRYRFIHNGLLFGAAVGTGFAAFESAGYAFTFLAQTGSVEQMLGVVKIRALLAPFGHILWTALAAAALWRVKGVKRFNTDMLLDKRFWSVFLFVVALHALWDCSLSDLLHVSGFFDDVKILVISFAGLVAVFGMIQMGLKQIKAEQMHMAKAP